MADENITIRRHKTMLNESFDLSFESTNSEIRGQSLPDLSTGYDSDKEDLKAELLQLRRELESARIEIQKLTEENLSLKQFTSRTSQSTCLDPGTQTITPSNKVSRNNMRLTFDDEDNTLIDLGQNTPTGDSTTDGATRPSTVTSRVNTTSLVKQPKVLSKDLQPAVQTLAFNRPRQKLCFISSNKVNNILTLALNYFPSYEVCHFVSTNCGIKQLLQNVNSKLLNFDKQDYCVIFIGEHDFKSTVNYYDLVVSIRESLMSITHTNIVLCLPTYKFNGYNNIFNSRVEIFNNLLYQDNCKHNYALLCDSNLDLIYDSTMFYKRSGVLNGHGMRIIFYTLRHYILQDFNSFSTTISPPKPQPLKGTIPYYFPAVKNNDNSIDKSYVLTNNNKDQFFRK